MEGYAFVWSPTPKHMILILVTVLSNFIYASGITKTGDVCCPVVELVSWNFDDTCPILTGPNANWFQFAFGEFTANDGVLTCGPRGGRLDSNPFTLTVPNSSVPQLDHTKWLAYDATPKPIPAGGKLFVEWVLSLTAFNTVPNPFPQGVVQGQNDFRFATGGAATLDLTNSLAFDFFLTNNRVYALYERLPFTRGSQGDYDSFTFFIPIAKRKPSDMHLLQLILDDETKTVTYTVDKRHGLTVHNVGTRLANQAPVADLGGTPELVFPTTLTIGFGTFTLLDFYPAATQLKHCCDHGCNVCGNGDAIHPCDYPPIREALVNGANENALPQYNPILGAPNLASFWDPVGTDPNHHIWGQGVVIDIKSIRAYTKSC